MIEQYIYIYIYNHIAIYPYIRFKSDQLLLNDVPWFVIEGNECWNRGTKQLDKSNRMAYELGAKVLPTCIPPRKQMAPHVLVYHGPLLIHLLGVAPSTFTSCYNILQQRPSICVEDLGFLSFLGASCPSRWVGQTAIKLLNGPTLCFAWSSKHWKHTRW